MPWSGLDLSQPEGHPRPPAVWLLAWVCPPLGQTGRAGSRASWFLGERRSPPRATVSLNSEANREIGPWLFSRLDLIEAGSSMLGVSSHQPASLASSVSWAYGGKSSQNVPLVVYCLASKN